jgi:hypothetical protein
VFVRWGWLSSLGRISVSTAGKGEEEASDDIPPTRRTIVLMVTCFSRHSRNRGSGERVGRGKNPPVIAASPESFRVRV